MKLSEFKSAEERRKFLENKLGKRLKKIGEFIDLKEKNIHCENLIGGTFLPLGVAGPLKIINVENVKEREVFVPLATTEGALVAAVNRGCKATYLSGGVRVYVEKIGTTRGPVFYVGDLKKALEFKIWLERNWKEVKKITESTSNHLKFLRFETFILPPYFYIRLYFDTDKAMGMNMVTIATQKLAEFVEENLEIKCLSVSGNFCIDKKPAYLNFLLGRGFKAWAETEISKEVLDKPLKTSAEKIFQVWLSKNIGGSLAGGSLGQNGHFANIASAFFAATGQDLAHTVEGSLGTTFAEVRGENLYFSVYLPSLMLGTVGGGTKLEIKKEAIEITQAKDPKELAEVLTGAVLCGELSLLASLSEGSLAKAHKRLGR